MIVRTVSMKEPVLWRDMLLWPAIFRRDGRRTGNAKAAGSSPWGRGLSSATVAAEGRRGRTRILQRQCECYWKVSERNIYYLHDLTKIKSFICRQSLSMLLIHF